MPNFVLPHEPEGTPGIFNRINWVPQNLLVSRDSSVSRSIEAKGSDACDKMAYQGGSKPLNEGRLANSMSMKQRGMLAPAMSSGGAAQNRKR